jgi:hypothetical protein
VRNVAIQLRLRLAAYDRADDRPERELASAQLGGPSSFQRIVLAPLRALAGDDVPKSAQLIVVDSLDESRHHGRRDERAPTIADLIAHAAGKDLLPSWLRIVASTRPELAVVEPFRGMRIEALSEQADANRADVSELVRARLPALVGAQLGAGVLDKAARTLAEKSDGNFVYATAALEQLGVSTATTLDALLATLPSTLEEVYAEWFQRLAPTAGEQREHLRPLLEVLVAAPEPLRRAELRDVLCGVRPSLCPPGGGGEDLFERSCNCSAAFSPRTARAQRSSPRWPASSRR